MNSRKITISLKKTKIIFGVIASIFLLFLIFAVIESLSLKPINAIDSGENTTSPTPFLPENEVPLLPTDTPQPFILEAGSYPPSVPEILPTLSNISPYSFPEGINPLTGQAPNAPELLERRPIASKIALYPRYVRPISGITLSDIVFEYYIEAGLTRFIAVFYGNDSDQVGPVRSGRFFDEHVARMYQSYLVFKYADPRVYDHLKSTDIHDFLVVPGESACPPFIIGTSERDTYNNIFFNTRKFANCLTQRDKDNTRPNLRAGYFNVEPPVNARKISDIFAIYSLDNYHYWHYDPLLHKYFRYQESNGLREEGSTPNYAPLMDIVTGQHLSSENIVYILVPHTFENQFQEEDEVYHIDLFGSGKAYLFRDGILLPAYWQRIETDQPLLITDLSGMPLPLKPGRTFYEVLGENSTFFQEGTQWHFQFETP